MNAQTILIKKKLTGYWFGGKIQNRINQFYFSHLNKENNALVLPYFTSTPSNRKISTLLLRPYAQTVFKVYAKVRKSAQFDNFAFLCNQNWLMKQIIQL